MRLCNSLLFKGAFYLSWNVLPVELRSSSSGLDTFAKHLKKQICLGKRNHDRARTFKFVLHFVKCDTVTVPFISKFSCHYFVEAP